MNNGIDPPRGMKPREFARIYNMSDGAVYQGIRDGVIPHVRVNGRIVILVRQFEEMSKSEPTSSRGD
jgi:hypothetical protein